MEKCTRSRPESSHGCQCPPFFSQRDLLLERKRLAVHHSISDEPPTPPCSPPRCPKPDRAGQRLGLAELGSSGRQALMVSNAEKQPPKNGSPPLPVKGRSWKTRLADNLGREMSSRLYCPSSFRYQDIPGKFVSLPHPIMLRTVRFRYNHTMRPSTSKAGRFGE